MRGRVFSGFAVGLAGLLVCAAGCKKESEEESAPEASSSDKSAEPSAVLAKTEAEAKASPREGEREVVNTVGDRVLRRPGSQPSRPVGVPDPAGQAPALDVDNPDPLAARKRAMLDANAAVGPGAPTPEALAAPQPAEPTGAMPPTTAAATAPMPTPAAPGAAVLQAQAPGEPVAQPGAPTQAPTAVQAPGLPGAPTAAIAEAGAAVDLAAAPPQPGAAEQAPGEPSGAADAPAAASGRPRTAEDRRAQLEELRAEAAARRAEADVRRADAGREMANAGAPQGVGALDAPREPAVDPAMAQAHTRAAGTAPGRELPPQPARIMGEREPQPSGRATWPGAPASGGPPLDISKLVTKVELEELSNRKLKAGVLSGIEAGPHYNFTLFETKEGELAASVQVWAEATIKDTRSRFDNMKGSYPNVRDTANITPYTFFASYGKTYYLAFMDLKRRRVVSVAINSDVFSPNQLFQITKNVHDRAL